MRPAAEYRNADPFQIADHQIWVMARHAATRKPRQIGIGDLHAGHRRRDMAQPRPQDQAQLHRGRTSPVADQGGQPLSVL